VARAKRGFVYEQLFPETAGVEGLAAAKRIPLDAIEPNPDQPRRGELPGIPELAHHIAEYGLLQPVVVTPPVAGRYTLIAGARRVAAFRLLAATDTAAATETGGMGDGSARWATIPAVERETEAADRLVLALAENLARHALSDVDTITSLRLLRDLRGWSVAELARRVGTSDVWIHRHFSVAGDPALSEHVQTGGFSVAKAYEVARAKSPEGRTAALAAALEGGPLRTIRRLAQEPPRRVSPNANGTTRAGSPSRSDYGSADVVATETGGDGAPPPTGVIAPAADGYGSRDGRSDYGSGAAAGLVTESVVATASPAGPRDLAEVARELGVTVPFTDLASTGLFFAAFRNGLAAGDGEALIRAMREDLRRLESLVRAAHLGARTGT
jgi:ParB-like chromosome segregation protein Spo0J